MSKNTPEKLVLVRHEWLLIPFLDSEMMVNVKNHVLLPEMDKLRYLTEKQKNENLTRQETLEIHELRLKLSAAILNRPTFEEIEKAFHGKENVLESKKKRLAEIEEKLKKLISCSSADIYTIVELQSRYDAIELSVASVLPENTILALINIALGINITDIQELTRNSLIDVYKKSRLYNCRPSDYIPGLFNDDDKHEIDIYAVNIFKTRKKRRGKNG
jgi:hypothetical protein